MNQKQVEHYWQTYLTTLPPASSRTEKYEVEQFGDRPPLADELVNLILQGVKTATCSALWEWEAEGKKTPEVGVKTIVLDGNGNPRAHHRNDRSGNPLLYGRRCSLCL